MQCNYLVLHSSQNINIYRLPRFMFDHSFYSKNLWKYYLFCYDMFYHCIYLKSILIVFIFSQLFLSKANGQTWSAEVNKCLYFGTEVVAKLSWAGPRFHHYGAHCVHPIEELQSSPFQREDSGRINFRCTQTNIALCSVVSRGSFLLIWHLQKLMCSFWAGTALIGLHPLPPSSDPTRGSSVRCTVDPI